MLIADGKGKEWEGDRGHGVTSKSLAVQKTQTYLVTKEEKGKKLITAWKRAKLQIGILDPGMDRNGWL